LRARSDPPILPRDGAGTVRPVSIVACVLLFRERRASRTVTLLENSLMQEQFASWSSEASWDDVHRTSAWADPFANERGVAVAAFGDDEDEDTMLDEDDDDVDFDDDDDLDDDELDDEDFDDEDDDEDDDDDFDDDDEDDDEDDLFDELEDEFDGDDEENDRPGRPVDED
jgi:hypothetical protein